MSKYDIAHILMLSDGLCPRSSDEPPQKTERCEKEMYTDDDILTRRDRVNDDLLRQLLDSDGDLDHLSCASPVCELPRCEADNGHDHSHSCDGAHSGWGIHDHPLAMVYSPVQKWRNIYDNESALVRGTIFEELDLPFLGGWGNGKNNGCASDGCNSNGSCGLKGGGGRNG